MALRVDLARPQLEQALQGAIASAKRGQNNSKSPDFKVLYEKDLAALQHAYNTITEIK